MPDGAPTYTPLYLVYRPGETLEVDRNGNPQPWLGPRIGMPNFRTAEDVWKLTHYGQDPTPQQLAAAAQNYGLGISNPLIIEDLVKDHFYGGNSLKRDDW